MIAHSCICGRIVPPGRVCICRANRPANPQYRDPVYRLNRKTMIERAWRERIPCWICGRGFRSKGEITADHVVSLRDGGSHELSNLAPAHRSCNSGRGAGANASQERSGKD